MTWRQKKYHILTGTLYVKCRRISWHRSRIYPIKLKTKYSWWASRNASSLSFARESARKNLTQCERDCERDMCSEWWSRKPRNSALLAVRGFAFEARTLKTAHLCCVLPHWFSSKRETVAWCSVPPLSWSGFLRWHHLESKRYNDFDLCSCILAVFFSSWWLVLVLFVVGFEWHWRVCCVQSSECTDVLGRTGTASKTNTARTGVWDCSLPLSSCESEQHLLFIITALSCSKPCCGLL